MSILSTAVATSEIDYFNLPTDPDDFSVLLPQAQLRRLNFTALDFKSLRRVIIEYIKTYYPDQFNDFVAANGYIMTLEILAAIGAKIGLRADLLHLNNYIGSATEESAVVNHLALINQRIIRQTPASVDVHITIDTPVTTGVSIAAGTSLTIRGRDGVPIIYELFSAPNDFTSLIVIPANKRGVIAFGLEGQFVGPLVFQATGSQPQIFTIDDAGALEEPLIVTVTTGGSTEAWQVITVPIERYGPNDKVVEVSFIGSIISFKFGNDVNGKALRSGQEVSIRYRTGGGVRGRIGVGQISEARQITPEPPANAPVLVSFSNLVPSIGGTDKETLDQAKARAPREAAILHSITTAGDYAVVSATYKHPVYGAVAKALATIKTSKNINKVDVFCLAYGADGGLATPSKGLKLGLSTFIANLNVLSDSVEIHDGVVKPVDIDMTVVVSKNADATVVRTNVEQAIVNFFEIANWEMGEPFYLSNFIDVVEAIDGVAYIDVFKPADNILQSDSLTSTPTSIALNELIVQGASTIRYYYERGRSQ